MTEADAVGPHHPVDGRPARVARAQAVPEVFRRRDDERRVAVVVERAQPQQVRTVPVQLDAPRLGQPLHRDLPFQPLDLVLRDSRHSSALRRKPCQVLFEDFADFSRRASVYTYHVYPTSWISPEGSEVDHKIRLVMPAKKEPQTAFGKRLFTLRKARGLTQVQLAEPSARPSA